jgi:hypothetical protein
MRFSHSYTLSDMSLAGLNQGMTAGRKDKTRSTTSLKLFWRGVFLEGPDQTLAISLSTTAGDIALKRELGHTLVAPDREG